MNQQKLDLRPGSSRRREGAWEEVESFRSRFTRRILRIGGGEEGRWHKFNKENDLWAFGITAGKAERSVSINRRGVEEGYARKVILQGYSSSSKGSSGR